MNNIAHEIEQNSSTTINLRRKEKTNKKYNHNLNEFTDIHGNNVM